LQDLSKTLQKANDMQVTQTLSQGLKQEFKVVLPSGDLAARLDSRLEEMRLKVQLKGFRPGKAPVAHLKKIYGREVMGEVVQDAVDEANRKIVEENNFRLAAEPKLDFPDGQEGVEKALRADGDLAYTLSFETLPKIELGSFDDISIERLVCAVGDEDVEKAVSDLAERLREYEAAPEESYKAEKHDRLTIDFSGKIDGEAFEGGTGEDLKIVLGSGALIPGFEDQLEGSVAGEQRVVKARFPDKYSVKTLAGRDAEFAVTVKAVERPKPLDIDDEFAKKWGFDTQEALKTAVRGNVEADFDKASRDKMKRALLDALDARYKFETPESLVNREFEGIWREFETERQRTGPSEAKSDDELRAEYRGIAERRVRLGLLLAEIGMSVGVTVEDKDLTQAIIDRARQFPGQEKAIWDFYRNDERALATLRAPIYEDRVVAHLTGVVQIAERTVSREELFAEEDEEASAPGAAPTAQDAAPAEGVEAETK
jgi:trigger factor